MRVAMRGMRDRAIGAIEHPQGEARRTPGAGASATPPRLSLRVVDLSLASSQEADEEVLDARQGFVTERSILLFDRPADDKTAPTEFQFREPCAAAAP